MFLFLLIALFVAVMFMMAVVSIGVFVLALVAVLALVMVLIRCVGIVYYAIYPERKAENSNPSPVRDQRA